MSIIRDAIVKHMKNNNLLSQKQFELNLTPPQTAQIRENTDTIRQVSMPCIPFAIQNYFFSFTHKTTHGHHCGNKPWSILGQVLQVPVVSHTNLEDGGHDRADGKRGGQDIIETQRKSQTPPRVFRCWIIRLNSFQPSTIHVLDENLGSDLKTHDLRPGWTPMMGRGIHLLCRRDPPWLGTLKVIFSWLVLGRHMWCPYPHSSPPPWSRVRSYLYMKYIPIWSVIQKRYWMEHPCPLPLADFLFWGGVSTPFLLGIHLEWMSSLNGSSPGLFGHRWGSHPQMLITGSGSRPHFKQHPWSCQYTGPNGLTKELIGALIQPFL